MLTTLGTRSNGVGQSIPLIGQTNQAQGKRLKRNAHGYQHGRTQLVETKLLVRKKGELLRRAKTDATLETDNDRAVGGRRVQLLKIADFGGWHAHRGGAARRNAQLLNSRSAQEACADVVSHRHWYCAGERQEHAHIPTAVAEHSYLLSATFSIGLSCVIAYMH